MQLILENDVTLQLRLQLIHFNLDAQVLVVHAECLHGFLRDLLMELLFLLIDLVVEGSLVFFEASYLGRQVVVVGPVLCFQLLFVQLILLYSFFQVPDLEVQLVVNPR